MKPHNLGSIVDNLEHTISLVMAVAAMAEAFDDQFQRQGVGTRSRVIMDRLIETQKQLDEMARKDR